MDPTPLVMMAMLAIVFWLFILRPAQRQRKQVSTLQSELKSGDRVMLSSGIFAEVVTLADDRAQVKVAEGVVLEVARGAIAAVDKLSLSPESEGEPARVAAQEADAGE